ncbi:MAG: alpha-amylase family glycosyl hydrolase [Ignavibacteriaceae bacterium]|nr:alpha-amylase family glycosyl hydrolase [Ignavibacteriaceae bacterium]
MVKYDFHITGYARKKYRIDESLFSLEGKVIITSPYHARVLSDKINNVRKSEGNADMQVTPGQVNGLGLLHEIFHYMLHYYEEKENPGVFTRHINYLKAKFKDDLDKVLLEFINQFPPMRVYRNEIKPDEYLNGLTGNKSNKELILEEIIILSLENINPATVLLKEFYDDSGLAAKTPYLNLMDETEKFFLTEKTIGSDNLPLISFLKHPILASPNSIDGQLTFILNKWGVYVYDKFYKRILSGKDLIYEDSKLFIQHGGEKGTPPVPTYEFDKDYFERLRAKLAAGLSLTDDERRFYYAETEQFTADIEWMPKVVMIAKNAYVWMHQLSKKYQREIAHLDQIPDEELNILAEWNFTSLWLIGIWERSSASKKIKILTGNPEAASSAYSLFDYVIALDLGGEDAFLNLKHRAWERGIRLASDMVPNHTGIYSKWIIEKPDYFIQTDHPPYPSYQFHGPNLSDDVRVQVRIEDKYYSKQDAAVVFQRVDSYTGDVKYIYHGNDGTNMPWNDTAQLNLLNPEVRESLIQTIMHVARKTPIIRFDAAMTLSKKHYQRLWFPQPGLGGAVPSRSDFSMTRAAFDDAMPVEFWREVVDRINSELPNTLLLAEAFWLMEGYFVRTLGMHRVYNSAFMHMLMKEENDKYKLLIKNTLEFNPEILKRYVNFMSNPDEETAINQFGGGDKYFGIALLMCTLPGLPMFAHGQIEGFSEKYGMEYQRSYYDEYVNEHLVWRHKTEIFPLTKKRYIFSQVYNFELYDLIDDLGNMNDNVIAYSNNVDGERSLIIYNNSYTEAKGTINYSANKINSSGNISNKKLADALGMKGENNIYYIYRDQRSNLEYIRSGHDLFESGLYIFLGGYQYNAFLDFREVYDNSGAYFQIHNYLNGRGVPSVENAKNELHLSGVHLSLRKLLSPDILYKFDSLLTSEKMDKPEIKGILSDISADINYFVNELNRIKHSPVNNIDVLEKINEDITSSCNFLSALRQIDSLDNKPVWFDNMVLSITIFGENGKGINRNLLLPVIVFRNLSHYEINDLPGSGNLLNKLMMDRIFFEVLENKGAGHDDIGKLIFLSKAIIKDDIPDTDNAVKFLDNVTSHIESADFIGLHEFEGIKYFNKENFESYLDWQLTFSGIDAFKEINMKKLKSHLPKSNAKGITNKIKTLYDFYNRIKVASYEAGYKLEEAKKLLGDKTDSVETGIKKGAVKKQTTLNKIENKIAGINKKTVIKKKAKLKKKADTKKLSKTKKEAKIKKKADTKKLAETKKKLDRKKKETAKKNKDDTKKKKR